MLCHDYVGSWVFFWLTWHAKSQSVTGKEVLLQTWKFKAFPRHRQSERSVARKPGGSMAIMSWAGHLELTLDTVDGRNPAPVDKWFFPLFIGFQPSKVVRISSTHRISWWLCAEWWLFQHVSNSELLPGWIGAVTVSSVCCTSEWVGIKQ